MSMSTTRQKTVAIRFPEELWWKIRARATGRRETGLAWLSRCAEVCLGVAETGLMRGGVTAGAVEPQKNGSDVVGEKKTTTRAGGGGAGSGARQAPSAIALSSAFDAPDRTGEAILSADDLGVPRCGCGHLETVHKAVLDKAGARRRCQAAGCGCVNFQGADPAPDPRG